MPTLQHAVAAAAPPSGATTTAVTRATASDAMGAHCAALPPGAMATSTGGATHSVGGDACFQPVHGANGTSCTVVPAP